MSGRSLPGPAGDKEKSMPARKEPVKAEAGSGKGRKTLTEEEQREAAERRSRRRRAIITVALVVFAVALVPVVHAAYLEFKSTLSQAVITGYTFIHGRAKEKWQYLAAGIACYVIIHLLLPPAWTRRILEREPVRRFFDFLTREPNPPAWGRVLRVLMYAVPVYLIALMLLAAAFNHYFPFRHFINVEAFLIGSAFAFHLVWVFTDLRGKQAKIGTGGYLFALVFVVLVNIEVLVLFLAPISVNIEWVEFNERMLGTARENYAGIGRAIASLWGG